MKALVKAKPEPGLWVEDIERPSPGPNEVLIRVRKTSICGTDVHIRTWDAWAQGDDPGPDGGRPRVHGRGRWARQRRAGLSRSGNGSPARGTSPADTAATAGPADASSAATTSASASPDPARSPSTSCCPAQNVFVVPDHIDDDLAAVLDPLGNATHTALRFDLVGEDVLITGAGPIGMMAAAIARHVGRPPRGRHRHQRVPARAGHGARRHPRRRRVAPRARPDVMDELGMTEGFDVGLEMSGAESAFNELLDAMNHGGRVAVLGIPAGPLTLDCQRRDLQGPQRPGDLRPTDLRDLVQDGGHAAERVWMSARSSPTTSRSTRFEEAFDIVERRRVRQGCPRLGVTSPRSPWPLAGGRSSPCTGRPLGVAAVAGLAVRRSASTPWSCGSGG